MSRQTVDDVAKKLELPIKVVKEMLWVLQAGPIDNRTLIQRTGLARNVINRIKRELAEWLEPVADKTQLNAEGVAEAKEVVGVGFQPNEVMWGFLENDSKYPQMVQWIEDLRGKRPASRRGWDQFAATAQTTARRALLMNFLGDIEGKRLMFLGDDDLMSATAAKFFCPEKVMVLDIDPRMLAWVKKAGEGKVTVTEYDARKPLPLDQRGNYDVVFTDPPYTRAGVEVFVARSVEALVAGGGTGRVYFCYGNSDRSKERFIPVQEVIVKQGLMLRWVLDKFSRYTGAESIGSTSSLFVCEVTPKTKVHLQNAYEESIYTG